MISFHDLLEITLVESRPLHVEQNPMMKILDYSFAAAFNSRIGI